MRTSSILWVVLVLGCGAAAKPNYHPGPTPAPGLTQAQLHDASVKVLARAGFSLRESVPAAGLTSSEWVVVGDAWSGQRYHSWRILASDGELEVLIDCRDQDGTNPPTPCPAGERHEKWITRVPDLRQLILDEAKRRQSAATSP